LAAPSLQQAVQRITTITAMIVNERTTTVTAMVSAMVKINQLIEALIIVQFHVQCDK
jgi:hypothetical protein